MKQTTLVLLAAFLPLAACQTDAPQEGGIEPTAVPPTESLLYPTVEATPPDATPVEEPQADTAPDGSGLSEGVTADLDWWLASQVFTEGGVPEGAAAGLVLLVDTPDGRYLNAAGVASV